MPIYDNQKFISVVRPEPENWEKDVFDIPFIEREELPISLVGSELFLINPNNVSKNDVDKKRKSFTPFFRMICSKENTGNLSASSKGFLATMGPLRRISACILG